MSITPAILSQLPLPEITSAVFYKRDQITVDLVCCDVEAGGQVWTFHEEAEGWDALLRHIEKLPGFRSDWQNGVVLPPFASSETVAFRR